MCRFRRAQCSCHQLRDHPPPQEQLLSRFSPDRADSRPGGKVTFFLSFGVTPETPQTCRLWFCDAAEGQEKPEGREGWQQHVTAVCSEAGLSRTHFEAREDGQSPGLAPGLDLCYENSFVWLFTLNCLHGSEGL